MQEQLQETEKLAGGLGDRRHQRRRGGGRLHEREKIIDGIELDAKVVDPEDVEMLEDLIMAAINDGYKKRTKCIRKRWALRRRTGEHGLLKGESMQVYIEPIGRLINEFSKLPGVGKKSAQRYAYKIIDMTDEERANLRMPSSTSKRR